MQLLRLLNRPLERSPESKRRNLTWYTPIIVPVWPQVKHQGVGAGVLGRGGGEDGEGQGGRCHLIHSQYCANVATGGGGGGGGVTIKGWWGGAPTVGGDRGASVARREEVWSCKCQLCT